MKPKLLLFCALQLALLSPAKSDSAPLNVDNLKDFTLLGFVPGQINFSAVEHSLHAVGSAKFSGMICIVATTPDHTRITLWPNEFDDTLGGIQVTEGSYKLKWEAICQQSQMVTRSVATATGLRLGLSKDAVAAQYGKAKSRDEVGQLFGYSSDRPLTELELKTACAKRANPEGCSSEDYAYGGDIQLTFRKGKLVSFELSRGIYD